MIRAAVLILVLGAAPTAFAQLTGSIAPSQQAMPSPPDAAAPARQGGDTIATATPIPSLPFSGAGTTTGFHDDYAGECLYNDGAPDVVYRLEVPAGVSAVSVSLCGSEYDTGLYVMDGGLHQFACDDDHCPVQSEISFLAVVAGSTYYVIVDGWGSFAGGYTLTVEEYVPCVLDLPPASVAEGEPPLVADYEDDWNGGCNTPPDHPFRTLAGDENGALVFRGVSGWYRCGDSSCRDTDWFYVHAGPTGAVAFTADAEQETYFWELPRSCDSVAYFADPLRAGRCNPGSTTTVGCYHPGDVIWFWVGPTVSVTPPGADREYDYVVWFVGLEPVPATERSATWSTVKALFE